ncbi:MAG: glycosyltransferase family 61 protein [Taibaiella sp.]|nr:glycosyltransferase family 61 protein [Taibaiella sp.]
MRQIKSFAKAIGLKVLFEFTQNIILKLRGYNILDRSQTMSFMERFQIYFSPIKTVIIPETLNSANNTKIVFFENQCEADAFSIWDYHDPSQNASLSRYGSVILRRKVLTTDSNANSFMKDIWSPDKRPVQHASVVIAPFSQYQDGIWYGGYWDYLFLVAVKLSRIRDHIPLEVYSKALIAYPLFDTPYERELMGMLDISSEMLTDTTKTKYITPRVITANSTTGYPHPDDIASLKSNIQKKFNPVRSSYDRIYISRSCRRNIINEHELITMLKKFDFKIIEDIPRSITEQITIYHNASFILGPHGASFSNIIWCEPGTHLMELFSCNYAPDFFAYLAALNRMEYSAYYEGMADPSVDYLDGLVEDISIDVLKLEKVLQGILKSV